MSEGWWEFFKWALIVIVGATAVAVAGVLWVFAQW